MVVTCETVKKILGDQIVELGQTKAEMHSKMLSYVKDEMEMRKIALQVHELKAKLAQYD